jgi:N-acetylglucosamine kinase-like BadF-type ATPase
MAYFLGIEGGGTRTTACLADERGRVLGRGGAGPSNPLKVGYARAQREILRAARRAVAAAARQGVAPASRRHRPFPPAGQRLETVVVGLAGAGRPEVERRMLAWLRRAFPTRQHLVTTDARLALEAALGDAPGLIVISGTGSIAFARDARGGIHRAGGWGTPFDDAGSGYDIARKAVAAALRASDGRGPKTLLTKLLCRARGLRDITEIVLRPRDASEVAALFPVVLRAARLRDRVAARLLEEAGRDLAELATALARRLGWKTRSFPVVISGGVFQASQRVRSSFARHLRHSGRHARVSLLRRPAVEGALLLARRIAGLGR